MASIKEKLDSLEEKIVQEKLEDIMGERFGRYSKYIIQERAIPDSRDGLKPVQRRILFAMYKLGMTPDKPYKKSARIAGDVMGKYHPHGDKSIYDAMVRMSQDWKMEVPLISMHGNNGSIDGDPAAAMRYTEARLSEASMYLLDGIEKRTVQFVPNFDDSELEPIVLPARFPNLLVNGATGIAAGYATNIPPHNLKEIIRATITRIDHPNCTLEDCMKDVIGPDFPTGGIVTGLDGVKQALRTGRGKVIIQSKTHFEEIAKGQYQIIVTEIPYEVNKSVLVKKMDTLRLEQKIDGILEVRDESDREGLRIAIDLKKGVSPDFVLTLLNKNTDLRISYNYNVIAIHNQRPTLMGLLDVLDAYINHQKEIITNRSNFDLAKAKKRLHVVMGLIKMVSILDQVIKTIRESKGKADSKERIKERFMFSEEQAEAIVSLQLYRLSSTDIFDLQMEENELNQKIIALTEILTNEKSLLNVLKKELRDVASKTGSDRRTQIVEEIEEVKITKEDLIVDENVMVGITKMGYIKRSSVRSFNQTPNYQLKENDCILFQKELSTRDVLLVFTNLGNYAYIPVHKLEEVKWKDLGNYINNIVSIENNEKIVNIYAISDFNTDAILLFATKSGAVKLTKLSDFDVSRYSKTMRAMKINKDDEVVSVDMTTNYNDVLITTKKARVLRFDRNDINIVGTTAGGIKGINLAADDEVTSAIFTRTTHDCLFLTSRGNIKRVKTASIPLSKRNKVGITLIKEIKGNPHHILGAVTMSYIQYRDNVKVTIITDSTSKVINSYDLKYSTNDSGKQVCESALGKPENIMIEFIEDVEVFENKPIIDSNDNNDDIDVLDEILIDNDDDVMDEKYSKFNQRTLFDDENF